MGAPHSDRRPVGVGLVGCGYATTSRHLPALASIGEARAVAVADLDARAVSDAAGRWSIARWYASASELVEDPEVEVVGVCVPAAAHADLVLEAIEAGKHVLVEKPLALSLDDADRIAERAARSPVEVIVAFNLRWHRLVRQARELVRAGAIGRVHAVRTVFADPVLDRVGLPPWRLRRELGGGALLDKGVHHFDLWRFLLDDEVEDVLALSSGDREDDETVAVIARLRSGCTAEAMLLDSTALQNELVLHGEDGTLHVDCYRSDGLRLAPRSELPGSPRARLRRGTELARQIAANLGEIRRGGVFNGSYAAEWRHVAAVIRDGEPAGCRVEDGRSALAIALAAASSASSGAPVRLLEARVVELVPPAEPEP